MATPLRHVLHAALIDADARAEITRSPEAYLTDHGWGHLDPADLQEAMLILADGALASEAITWVAGAEALDDFDGDATQALTVALTAMDTPVIAEDPAALDGFEDVDREIGSADPNDLDDLDDLDGIDGVAAPGDAHEFEPEEDHVTLDDLDGIGVERSSGPLDDHDIHDHDIHDIDIHDIDIHDIDIHDTESGGAHDAPDHDWDGLL